MNPRARQIQRTYLVLMLGNTLAGSFIWGINTLFLLDAGLSNLEAFGANAFFTAGMVIFEVPTGVVADTWGRRTSYLLGTVTLSVSTVLYWVVALVLMKDLGFVPDRERSALSAVRKVLGASIEHGWRKPPVRWLMLGAPFAGGVGIYAFYAFQPHLLELHGDAEAYWMAGLAASLVGVTQIAGGWAAPAFRRLFAKRTGALLVTAVIYAGALVLIGLTSSLWLALVLVAVWALMFAADEPIRQAYLNDMIPSKQRATVLSFDSLMQSSGGVVLQPGLGRVADVHGYPLSFALSGLFALLVVPFVLLSRRQHDAADLGTSAVREDRGRRGI